MNEKKEFSLDVRGHVNASTLQLDTAWVESSITVSNAVGATITMRLCSDEDVERLADTLAAGFRAALIQELRRGLGL